MPIVETVNFCVPKGDAMKPLSRLFDDVNFPISEYNSENRTYRPQLEGRPVRVKIMAEKDVALQVAVGNYDVGCCGLDWIKEHTTKYRASDLHVFRRLGICKKKIFLCSGLNSGIKCVSDLQEMDDFVRLVSEYPNLAESFAIHSRLQKFKIFSAWGSVEAYPPEHADVVLLAAENQASLQSMGLHILSCKIESELCVVVNRKSFMEKDLTCVLEFF